MEKLTMSRPAAFNCLAFSATSMIALGLARPMRWASVGMDFLTGDGRRNSREMVAHCGAATGPEATYGECASAAAPQQARHPAPELQCARPYQPEVSVACTTCGC